MKKRVVVTGLGAVTPIGNSADVFWESVKKGRVGIGQLTKFDVSGYKVSLAAEVKGFSAAGKIDTASSRRMEEFARYAVVAAKEAFEDSGLDMALEEPFRAGTAIGTGVGSLQVIEGATELIRTQGADRMRPFMIPQMIGNMAAANAAIQLGLKGKCINISTACTSGTNSIGEAFRTIQYGEADIMLAGGAESCISPTCVGGFAAMRALSLSGDPAFASIPFDKERNGFVIGEGAGVVVLEELEHANNRGAKIYAELKGYGSTADAYHITSPLSDGSGAAKAMELSLQDAGMAPGDITYINAHGTSTYQNDLFETVAIKKVFGDAAKTVKINSTKSMVGHLLGAAGGVEFITCVKSIADGFIHQTMGTKETAEECDLDYMISHSSVQEVSAAMTNSFGFGGHNAVLVVSKYMG